MSIQKKIINIQAKVSGVKRDSKGYQYNYESLDSIIDLLHPLLADHGLGIYHNIDPMDGDEPNRFMCVTTLFDENGEKFVSKCPIIDSNKILNKGNSMQGIGSAITYARRYNLKNLFNLYSTDDDASAFDVKKPEAPKPTQVVTKKTSEVPIEIPILFPMWHSELKGRMYLFGRIGGVFTHNALTKLGLRPTQKDPNEVYVCSYSSETAIKMMELWESDESGVK